LLHLNMPVQEQQLSAETAAAAILKIIAVRVAIMVVSLSGLTDAHGQ
jgi:hypothetical protein